MNAAAPGEAIQARIGPALASSIELVIAVWGNPASPVPFSLYRLRTEPDVAQEFRDVGIKHLSHIADHDVIDFDAGHTPDEGETMELPVRDFEYPNLVAALLGDGSLERFDADEEEDVAFYAFRVRHDGVAAAFVKQVSAVKLAKRNFIATQLIGDRVAKLESEILTFSPGVDLLFESNSVWITNASTYRSLFRGANAVAAAVGLQVAKVSAAVPIANREAFEEACRKDPRMMAKLALVASRPYLSLLTPAVLRRVIKESHLPAELLTSDGKLVHDSSPKRRWMVLRILDDAYVQSTATKLRYAANSKRQL